MSSNEPVRNGCEEIYDVIYTFSVAFMTAMIIAYLISNPQLNT